MRVAILDPDDYVMDDEGRKFKRLVQNTDSIIVNIGDIRDISVQIPINNLIDLELPPQAR